MLAAAAFNCKAATALCSSRQRAVVVAEPVETVVRDRAWPR
jgi:hypothetical protein